MGPCGQYSLVLMGSDGCTALQHSYGIHAMCCAPKDCTLRPGLQVGEDSIATTVALGSATPKVLQVLKQVHPDTGISSKVRAGQGRDSAAA
jgi:hypothetical protein